MSDYLSHLVTRSLEPPAVRPRPRSRFEPAAQSPVLPPPEVEAAVSSTAAEPSTAGLGTVPEAAASTIAAEPPAPRRPATPPREGSPRQADGVAVVAPTVLPVVVQAEESTLTVSPEPIAPEPTISAPPSPLMVTASRASAVPDERPAPSPPAPDDRGSPGFQTGARPASTPPGRVPEGRAPERASSDPLAPAESREAVSVSPRVAEPPRSLETRSLETRSLETRSLEPRPLEPTRPLEPSPRDRPEASDPLAVTPAAHEPQAPAPAVHAPQPIVPLVPEPLVPEPEAAGSPRDDGPPTVKVTIGRVEVRAESPRPAPAPRAVEPRQPSLSLADYLKEREGAWP